MCKNSTHESTQARLDTHSEETFVWELSHLTNVSLQGICVSMWKKTENMGCFSEDDVVLAFNAVGKGHGARKGFFSVGINAHFGPRRGSRPKPSPNQPVKLTPICVQTQSQK